MYRALPEAFKQGVLTYLKNTSARAPLSLTSFDRIYSGYKQDQPKSDIQALQDAQAYIIGRMGATLSVMGHVLGQLPPSYVPSTLLDIGSGTGSTLWALPSSFAKTTRCTLLEQNPHMIEAGKALATSLSHIPQTTWVQQKLQHMTLPPSDLVICSYVLNELDDASANDLFPALLQSAQRFLVVVEPGTPAAFQKIARLRTEGIQNGLRPLAPCGHGGLCPIQNSTHARDWCHFSLRHERMGHPTQKTVHPWEDEKYSYLILEKLQRSDQAHIPAPKSPPAEARILKRPLKSTGTVTLSLCTPGTERIERITKKDKGRYKSARKAAWGDIWDLGE